MHAPPTRKIALIATGGTIEKTYDPLAGVLHNNVSVLDVMLARLELRGVDLSRVPLMNKDSLEMEDRDHEFIARTTHQLADVQDGILIVHGTDRLTATGELILKQGMPKVPVVLTGAMRPYELRSTDALQNLTEALLAVQMLSPGVYCVFHNQVLRFPGVVKDRVAGTFLPRQYASTEGDPIVD
ncbi:MAG: asparaginase [Deltaproteobacteria bacterium]|nr:asparaginase [Deltaproteobacteria bacterium]